MQKASQNFGACWYLHEKNDKLPLVVNLTVIINELSIIIIE